MPEPFTLRMYLPDGDPDGVRVIDRMNWTGVGIRFPRRLWQTVRSRNEFSRPGVYILVGYQNPTDDLPTIYIGQGDGIVGRIEQHIQNKEFWEWGIAFASNNNSLNRGHITWLEHSLIDRATKLKRCTLDNGQAPNEPALSESEKADTKAFLNEILRILPLAGLHAFEQPKSIASPSSDLSAAITPNAQERDTIVVPAHEDGFKNVFLGQDCWYAIRISGGMLQRIRFIAVYRTAPVSAVTHYATVDHIEPYGEEGKYKVVFAGKAKELTPQIPLGKASKGQMQAPRYTSFDRLRESKQLMDLFN